MLLIMVHSKGIEKGCQCNYLSSHFHYKAFGKNRPATLYCLLRDLENTNTPSHFHLKATFDRFSFTTSSK